MIEITGKALDLALLVAELTEAGIEHRGLATTGTFVAPHRLAGRNFLHTYDDTGERTDLPAKAEGVVSRHVAPPPPVPSSQRLIDLADRLDAAKTGTEQRALMSEALRTLAATRL